MLLKNQTNLKNLKNNKKYPDKEVESKFLKIMKTWQLVEFLPLNKKEEWSKQQMVGSEQQAFLNLSILLLDLLNNQNLVLSGNFKDKNQNHKNSKQSVAINSCRLIKIIEFLYLLYFDKVMLLILEIKWKVRNWPEVYQELLQNIPNLIN